MYVLQRYISKFQQNMHVYCIVSWEKKKNKYNLQECSFVTQKINENWQEQKQPN